MNFVQHRKRSAIHIYGLILLEISLAMSSLIIQHTMIEFPEILSFSGLIYFILPFTCYMLPQFMIVGIVYQFVCATIGLRDRIDLITNRISIKYRLSSFEVFNYIILYQKLFKISEDTQKYLTMQVLPILAGVFINLVFQSYLILRAMLRAGELTFVVAGLVWSVVYTFPLFIIINASESFSESLKTTKSVCHEILWSQRILDVHSRKAFSHFLKSMKISDLKMKTIFFDLDWKLIFQVIFEI